MIRAFSRATPFNAAIRAMATLLFAVTAAFGTPAAAAPVMDHLTLVVPAAAGGGWHLTAQAMQNALQHEGIVRSVDIVRHPGGGGLVGLSQFVARERGHDNVLLIGGLTMLGAAMADEAAVSLRDVTPIARLTGDWGLIAVRKDSPIHSFDDLKQAMIARSKGLRWSGGALGGPDQALVWSMASQLGVPLDDVLYYGKVGGRRAADALGGGRADVAVSGYAEFAPFIHRGDFRTIAVASPTRLQGLAIPTLREKGMDVSIMNWRGVFAAPGLTTYQQELLGEAMARMRLSPTWRTAVAESHWTEAYLDSAAFSNFIDRETTPWPSMVNPPLREDQAALVEHGGMTRFQLWLVLGIISGLVVFAVQLFLSLRRRRRSLTLLEAQYGELATKLNQSEATKAQLVLDGIQDDFGEWSLSHAERDVAWFMLRGLPLKEIADLRGTSERTVRQQAQSIYRKAGLEGRSDLAGRVLERFI